MSDENNTHIDDTCAEAPPEQPFFAAIRECIHTVPASKIRAAARACLALAEEMVAAAVESLVKENNGHIIENGRIAAENKATIDTLRDELKQAEKIYTKAGNSMAEEIKELKARITEMEAEANEDRKLKKDYLAEISKHGIEVAKLCRERDNLGHDCAALQVKIDELVVTKIRLSDIVAELATVIRNS